jgi:hypothetical protein
VLTRLQIGTMWTEEDGNKREGDMCSYGDGVTLTPVKLSLWLT